MIDPSMFIWLHYLEASNDVQEEHAMKFITH